MPEIEIRHAVDSDLSQILHLDHNYTSDFVWQMEVQRQEEGQTRINFRVVRLPRSVRVDYPRAINGLLQNWQDHAGLLVALIADEIVGYASLTLRLAANTAWITDMAVKRRVRRQGVGTALLLAAQEWGQTQDCQTLILEMQPKNYPAICLSQKLGFELCGYNDRYYPNHDIGLFFAKSLR